MDEEKEIDILFEMLVRDVIVQWTGKYFKTRVLLGGNWNWRGLKNNLKFRPNKHVDLTLAVNN